MANNLFENARDAVGRFTQNRGGGRKANQEDMQAAKQAIQSAYSQCSQEEKQQLQQLEQQLEQHNQSLR
ncbi:DUF3813 domain-containing protein [Halobacillus salinus]|uniref:DUF3813 domain-containing protein n=1 Tax=Halobacillus salinus TaxID=192814 RepID=A0A4Z0H7M1_9BACI|nr:DUF3813 domain-containing protein [Halobacillus salinus]TGB05241.1 DUF3813 domain-containing protein [Halobacillus salinus]